MSDLMVHCNVTNMRMPIGRWVDIPLQEFVIKFSMFADDIHFDCFPPLGLLNDYLILGEQNEGMGNNALWYPFCLTELGYAELVDSINQDRETPLHQFDVAIRSLRTWRDRVFKYVNENYNIRESRLPIKFYHPKEAYGEFSNFSNHGILMDNQWWKTVEHYHQAQKFTDQAYQDKIRQADTPKIASVLGRNKNRAVRKDWDDIKDTVMTKAVLEKFSTHQDLKQLLLSTGDKDIVEDVPNDHCLGCDDGGGENKLGKILQRVRYELKTRE